jgi:hypothetical protein
MYVLASFSFKRAEGLMTQAFNANKARAGAIANAMAQQDMNAAFEARAKASDPYKVSED